MVVESAESRGSGAAHQRTRSSAAVEDGVGGGALPFRSLIWAGPRRDRERRTGPEGERESSDPRLSRERAGSAPY